MNGSLSLAGDASHDAAARRAVGILVWAQSVLGAQVPVQFILGGLAGALLAEDPALATLPVSLAVLGSMLAAPPVAAIMGRFGRRTGFLVGVAAGTAGSALAAHAIVEADFTLFCAAALLQGVYLAAQNFYRFAAADLASDAFRPRAIGWVMAGGLAAALIGPQIVIWFGDALEPIPYAGAYAVLVVLNLAGALPLFFLDIPTPPRRIRGAGPARRPLLEILSERRVAVAILCGMVCYAMMSLVMTSTPLAMLGCGFHTADAAGVVSAHVVAMYAPSFVTGALVGRFGAPRVIAVGLVCLACASAVGLSGIEIEDFTLALLLLGIGWNFGFVGATAMLAEAHRPEDATRVQGANDFLVMGLVTLASFASGALLAGPGWEAVNLAALPLLSIAAAALLWLRLREGPGRIA